MGKVIGVGGVFIRSENPEKLYEWYERHLGVRRKAQHESFTFHWSESAASGRAGSTTVALFPHDTTYFGPGGRSFMVNLCVDGLETLLADLRENGVAIEGQEDCDYGRFAWITDPEGNRVELWEPPKESKS